jgi:uncharacterized protein YciI
MLHVLLVRYTAPLELVIPHVPGHVAYLERAHTNGTFLLSGQTVPDSVGGVILAVGPREQVESVATEDPFVVAGVAAYEVITVDPARLHDDLRDLLAPSDGDEGLWDDAALTRLRTGDLGVLREGRPLRPVLQHGGQALLEAGVAGAQDLARQCVDGLRERDWAGDEVLVLELRAALGETVEPDEHRPKPWPLTPVPVWLRELAGCLDGDPTQGRGAIDLRTGDVYHPGSLEGEPPDELDEESDSSDPDRWLTFRPESGEGYRDMLDFAADLPEGRLRERLFRALDGRGAFRRFRDVLQEAPEPHLARWYLFRDERELGRARQWLATEGYRSDPERSGR